MRLLERETLLVLMVMLLPVLGIGCNRAVSEVLPDESDGQVAGEQPVRENAADEQPESAAAAVAEQAAPAANPEPAAASAVPVPPVPNPDADAAGKTSSEEAPKALPHEADKSPEDVKFDDSTGNLILQILGST